MDVPDRIMRLQILDVAVYSVLVTVIVTVIGIVLVVPFGADVLSVQDWLFISGWVLFGLAILKLYPNHPGQLKRERERKKRSLKKTIKGSQPADHDERDEAIQRQSNGRQTTQPSVISRLGQTLVPDRFVLDKAEQPSQSIRLLVSSMCVLTLSFALSPPL